MNSEEQKMPLDPQVISVLEEALEERKTPKDRRQQKQPLPKEQDRRSGVDRRDLKAGQ